MATATAERKRTGKGKGTSWKCPSCGYFNTRKKGRAKKCEKCDGLDPKGDSQPIQDIPIEQAKQEEARIEPTTTEQETERTPEITSPTVPAESNGVHTLDSVAQTVESVHEKLETVQERLNELVFVFGKDCLSRTEAQEAVNKELSEDERGSVTMEMLATANRASAERAKIGGREDPFVRRNGKARGSRRSNEVTISQEKGKKQHKQRGEERKPRVRGGKMSAIDAAAKVLKGSRKPMTCPEMIEKMAERDLWKSPSGLTPIATICKSIGDEIRKRGKESRFRKISQGLYEHT